MPPGPADPDQLVGGLLVVRREHHADAGQHGVELAVVERQGLGVGLPPVEVDAALGGGRAPGVEQLGGQVAGDDVGAGQRGRDGGVAGAGSDVEHALARAAMPAGLDQDAVRARR